MTDPIKPKWKGMSFNLLHIVLHKMLYTYFTKYFPYTYFYAEKYYKSYENAFDMEHNNVYSNLILIYWKQFINNLIFITNSFSLWHFSSFIHCHYIRQSATGQIYIDMNEWMKNISNFLSALPFSYFINIFFVFFIYIHSLGIMGSICHSFS